MKEEKKRKVDTLIKIALIIIIILLVMHNCALSYSKIPNRVPSGNVNIIEIKCDNTNNCEEKPDNNKPSENIIPAFDENPNENKEDNPPKKEEEQVPPKEDEDKKDDEKENEQQPDDTPKICIEEDGKYYGKDGREITFQEYQIECENKEEEPIIDKEFGVIDKWHNKVTWNGSSDLKIFTNSIYELDNVIAPEYSNTYQFVVKNNTDYKMLYNISFEETNPYNIDMRYKLKKNDTYIIDHYVRYDELVVSAQYLSTDQNDTYYLDWKWFSGDNDTEAGKDEARYNLKINVEAESTNG